MKISLLRTVLSSLLVMLPLYGFAESKDIAESPSAANWEERFQRAEWVSRLRIESVGRVVNPALSLPQMVAVQGYRYNASVLRDWKGAQAGSIKFQVDFSACPEQLKVNQEYIVFGSSDYQGALEGASCDDLIAVEEAQQLLSALDKMGGKLGS